MELAAPAMRSIPGSVGSPNSWTQRLTPLAWTAFSGMHHIGPSIDSEAYAIISIAVLVKGGFDGE